MGSTVHTSFVCGSKYGPRSAKWILSASGKDLYISCAAVKKSWHVSLHASGRWHLKKNQNNGEAPVIKAHQGDIVGDKSPLGLCIVIPDSCLRQASDTAVCSDPSICLDRPVETGILEVSILLWEIGFGGEPWPGAYSGTEVKLACRVSDKEIYMVLTRYLRPNDEGVAALNRHIENFVSSFDPVVLDSPERRAVIIGKNAAGGLQITECAID